MKNESALPVADTVANGERYETLNTGLTKLEYFAGLAMQGILCGSYSDIKTLTQVANKSVIVAKELIKQLENDI